MARSSRLVTKPTGFNIGFATSTTNASSYTPAPTATNPATSQANGKLVIHPGYSNFLELLFTGAPTAGGFTAAITRYKKLKLSTGGDTSTWIPYTVAGLDGQLGNVAAGAVDSTYTDPDYDDHFLAKTLIKIWGDPAIKVTSPEENGTVASVVLDCQGADLIEIGIDINGDTSGFSTDSTAMNILWGLV